jgi:hypothetical protein
MKHLGNNAKIMSQAVHSPQLGTPATAKWICPAACTYSTRELAHSSASYQFPACYQSAMLFQFLSLLFLSSVIAKPGSPSSSTGPPKKPATTCKCTSFDSCWPSASDFAQLSSTLSHPVFSIHPIGFPCHNPSFSAVQCKNVQSHFTDGLWRTDQPGASITDNWEYNATSSCFVLGNQSTPCGQGRVPVVGVNATTISDVQNAVNFAIKHNLKVRVKNTG